MDNKCYFVFNGSLPSSDFTLLCGAFLTANPFIIFLYISPPLLPLNCTTILVSSNLYPSISSTAALASEELLYSTKANPLCLRKSMSLILPYLRNSSRKSSSLTLEDNFPMNTTLFDTDLRMDISL